MPIVNLGPGQSLPLRSNDNFKYSVHNLSKKEEGAYAIALTDPPIAIMYDIAPDATHRFTINQDGGAIDNRGKTDLAVTTPGL